MGCESEDEKQFVEMRHYNGTQQARILTGSTRHEYRL